MKSIDDALACGRSIFGAFELAEVETDPDRRAAWLTFVVVGGGPTGVEMAGQLAELSRRSYEEQLPGHRSRHRPGDRRRGRRRVCWPSTAAASQRASEPWRGRGRGAALHAGRRRRRRGGARCRSRRRPGRSRLARRCGPPGWPPHRWRGAGPRPAAELTRTGQVSVQPDLTCPGIPRSSSSATWRPTTRPGSPRSPSRAGEFAARQIVRRLRGKDTEPRFQYRDKGIVATISRFNAIAKVGPLRLSGFRPGPCGWAFTWSTWSASRTGCRC